MCAVKLNKKELAAIVADQMSLMGPKLNEPLVSGFRRTARHIRKKKPDRHWLLMVLSSLKPDHPIFSDRYVKMKAPKPAEHQIMIANKNGFYDKMRGVHQIQKGPGRKSNLLTKAAREAEKTRTMEAKVKAWNKKLKKQTKRQQKEEADGEVSSDDESKKRRAAAAVDSSDSDSDSSDSENEHSSKLNPLATRSQVSHVAVNPNPYQAASMFGVPQ